MTALRPSGRQSAGYFPTTQVSTKQGFYRPFGGVPFRTPRSPAVLLGATHVSRASIKTYEIVCSIHLFSILSSKKSMLCRKTCSLLLCAKELISSDALIFLRRNGGEAMKYECLKLEERRIIEEMYAKGAKPGEIAERVGKCQATIYRELERGKTGETDSRFRQGYSAAVAEARVNRSYRNRGRRKAAQ